MTGLFSILWNWIAFSALVFNHNALWNCWFYFLGVWATKPILKGKKFGPFVGDKKKRSQVKNNVYMWEVRNDPCPLLIRVQYIFKGFERIYFKGFIFSGFDLLKLISQLNMFFKIKNSFNRKCVSSDTDCCLYLQFESALLSSTINVRLVFYLPYSGCFALLCS